ncbi:MAG: hypothetical protein GXP19_09520 [Gammaproteobacteria bacterium]|nr:hypothetical protein [Gammaproteobacteria bacterium]
MLMTTQVFAHHVLGRPSYSLNEDSNTPPRIQIELLVGDYSINYMAFPAFPKPNEQGRINFYASRIDNGKSYSGEVTFKIKNDSWFSSKTETLGTQTADDHVYHQSFMFKEGGDYIISAEFQDNNTPYKIDFPLRVGAPATIGPFGLTAGFIIVILLIASTLQQKKLQRLRTKRHHADNSDVDNLGSSLN